MIETQREFSGEQTDSLPQEKQGKKSPALTLNLDGVDFSTALRRMLTPTDG